ncbi:MAG: sulfatase [Myxococcota bacterium]
MRSSRIRRRIVRSGCLWTGVLAASLVCFAGCGTEPADPTPGPAAGSGALSSADPAREVRPRPRVVILVSIDTLRADHLGAYGYDRPTSPVIDALAREGAVFEDANSTAPWTVPAHASILTGLYPRRHGANRSDRMLIKGIPTLATRLSRVGFTTAAAVNTFRLGRAYGLETGFEHYLYVPEATERVGPSTWVTDQAIDWLKRFREERLFLFVHYFDVHTDYASKPEFERQFVSDYDGVVDGTGVQVARFQQDKELADACRTDPDLVSCVELDPDKRKLPPIELDDRDRQHLTDLYDANLRQMDQELDRLLSFARQEGILDEALLILTSDHGEEFLEHGGLGHSRTQYQEMLWVPLILRGPGIPPGTRIETPVSLVDVVPTVLSALGMKVPESTDGMDLAPLWQADVDEGAMEAFEDRILFAEANLTVTAFDHLFVARQGRYKLLYDRQTKETWLYDLESDPGELRDIAAEQPEIAATLRKAVLRRSPGDFGEGEKVDLSETQKTRLRALGYLE